MVCYYALGNPERMKSAFQMMLNLRKAEKEKNSNHEHDEEEDNTEKMPNDTLQQEIREKYVLELS